MKLLCSPRTTVSDVKPVKVCIGGSKGAPRMPPSGSKFFYFHAVLEKTLDHYWKEYEGKYNFRSNYSPTAN